MDGPAAGTQVMRQIRIAVLGGIDNARGGSRVGVLPCCPGQCSIAGEAGAGHQGSRNAAGCAQVRLVEAELMSVSPKVMPVRVTLPLLVTVKRKRGIGAARQAGSGRLSWHPAR